MNFKKIILSLFFVVYSTYSYANYTLIVPQEPGGGTSVWAEILAKHLSKYLNEPIVVRNIPGTKDIYGFNYWHEFLRNDDKTIMVSHGGNAMSYLLDDVKYDYKLYRLVSLTNLDIVVAKSKTFKYGDKVIIPAGSGYEPDGLATTLLVCGELKTFDEYKECFNKNILWLKGINGNEKRLGFVRGEYNSVRETPSAWFRFYKDIPADIWFSEGVYNLKTKMIINDKNFDDKTFFENVYKEKWGKLPSSDNILYKSYKMSKNFRDILQKTLWVNKNNPNYDKIVNALNNMLNDEDARHELEKETGHYDWIVGEEGNKYIQILIGQIDRPSLEFFYRWNKEVYGYSSVIFKENLLNGK